MKYLLKFFPLALLAGCTIGTPYKPSKQVETLKIQPSDSVVVAVTHAVIKSGYSNKRKFLDYVAKVEKTLEDSPGFLGHQKKVKLLGQDAYTISVWDSDSNREAFVRSPVHWRAMKSTQEILSGAASANRKVEFSQVPVSMKLALDILKNDQYSVYEHATPISP